MNIQFKKGKVRIYKSADGVILRTGSYVDEKGNDVFADKKKFNWVDCIEVDEKETTDVHLAQVDIQDGKIVKDNQWENSLMPPNVIISKHKKNIQKDLEKELLNEAPDTIKIAKLLCEEKKIDGLKTRKLSREEKEKEIYSLALKNLDSRKENGEKDKPEIRKKIQAKIKELNDK